MDSPFMDQADHGGDDESCPSIPWVRSGEGVQHPAWYSPLRVLALFSCSIFFTYVDRGVIASNGVQGDEHRGIQHDFNLNLFQLGILPAAFMIGLLLASVAFAELTKHIDAFRLIGVGNAIWCIASIGCGMSIGFWSLLACRIAMGIGEASIINLATPFIDDVAPPRYKTLWFSIYFTSWTVGSSVGYFFGGAVGLINWRYPFFLQAAAAVPLTAFLLFAPPLQLKTLHCDNSSSESLPSLAGDEEDSYREASKPPSLMADLYCLLWEHPSMMWTAFGPQ